MTDAVKPGASRFHNRSILAKNGLSKGLLVIFQSKPNMDH